MKYVGTRHHKLKVGGKTCASCRQASAVLTDVYSMYRFICTASAHDSEKNTPDAVDTVKAKFARQGNISSCNLCCFSYALLTGSGRSSGTALNHSTRTRSACGRGTTS